MPKKKNSAGFGISDTYTNVISSIASSAASQIEGVASITYDAGLSSSGVFAKRKRNNAIVVTLNQEIAIIDISVNIYYGYVIPEIVAKMQEKIKEEVEKATFYRIKSINVTVVGVVFSE